MAGGICLRLKRSLVYDVLFARSDVKVLWHLRTKTRPSIIVVSASGLWKSVISRACERSGKRSGAAGNRNRVERSGALSGRGRKRWSRAERGAGGRGAATERGAGVTEIGWSAERLFRRSRSAHAPLTCFPTYQDGVSETELLASSHLYMQLYSPYRQPQWKNKQYKEIISKSMCNRRAQSGIFLRF